MKKIAALLLGLLLAPVAAQAQSTGTVVTDCTTGVGLAYTPGSTRPMTLLPTGTACVSASVNASISGFTAASTGTPITAAVTPATGTLPAGAVVVATNVGTTNGAYCQLGASATTASQYIAPNGGWFAFTVGGSTQLTCATSTSTTTVNLTGGAGLPTGTGGGGGSGGGGGGAVTVADGADVTQGAIADAAVAAGAAGTESAKLRRLTTDMGATATSTATTATNTGNTATSTATTATNTGNTTTQTTALNTVIGTQGDAACGTDTGTCSVVALQKRNNAQQTALGTAALPYATTPRLLSAPINFSSSGDNIVVTRAVGTIKVYMLSYVCASAVTQTIKNGTSTALSGAMPNVTSSFLPYNGGEPYYVTTGTNNFVINLGSAVSCQGTVWYIDS